MPPRKAQLKQTGGLSGALFFFMLLLGVGAILVLKYMNVPQIVVTIVPVIIMLVYAFAIYSIRKLRLRLDQAGDNLYYLGFLYTLTSLAYALYEFSANTGNGDASGSTASIITNFGIALATTIVGLALRVVFSQMRVDPIETEEEARLELADASRQLKVELDSIARDFSMFRRSLQQMTIEAFEELEETIGNATKSGASEFKTSVSDFSKSITETNASIDVYSSSLKESTVLLTKTISDLAAKMNDIKISDDFLFEQLNPAIQKIEEAADAALKIAETDSTRSQTWEGIGEKVLQIVENMQDLTKLSEQNTKQFQEESKSAETAVTSLKILSDNISDLEFTVQSISENSKDQAAALIKSIKSSVADSSDYASASESSPIDTPTLRQDVQEDRKEGENPKNSNTMDTLNQERTRSFGLRWFGKKNSSG